jgi:ectoine hydroxylase-related dioxygenase (phytanoyl-CoA dioxygenase family)
MSVYKSKFDSVLPTEIAHALNVGTGYYVLEDVINEEALPEMLSCFSSKEYLINNNDVGVVRAHSMNFHSHTLAASKSCYDLITDRRIRAICASFFAGPYKLSNQRMFETHTKAHMPWHTDNNLQAGNTFKGKHTLPGILFLFYLSDVSDTNPFQLVSHSHKWSAEHNERFFSDALVAQKHGDEIVTVQAPRGTLVLCNTHLIHRAKPFDSPGFKRTTFLFQVDALSDEYAGHGEKILINPAFIEDTSLEVLSYLGFGMLSNYPTFPQTSVATLLPQDLWSLQKSIVPKAVRGLLKAIIKRVLPGSLFIKLKNLKYLS